jgi:hypothetical protein
MCRLYVRQCCPDHQRRASGIALLLIGVPALLAVIGVSFTAPVFLSLVPLSALLVVSAIGTLQVSADGIPYPDLLPPRRAMVFSTIAVGTVVIFIVKAYLWLLLVTIKIIRKFGDRYR